MFATTHRPLFILLHLEQYNESVESEGLVCREFVFFLTEPTREQQNVQVKNETFTTSSRCANSDNLHCVQQWRFCLRLNEILNSPVDERHVVAWGKPTLGCLFGARFAHLP